MFVFMMCVPLSAYSNEYIPPQAFDFKLNIQEELDKHFDYIPDYNYVPALIEHESCISLKHSRCWNSKSSLKTQREEGAGLGQVTKAFKADGTLRFDTLMEMRNRYKNELHDASWSTIYQRPDIQIRIITLMLRDDYKRLYDIKDDWARLHMVDAAYNGGLGGLNKERRACGLKAGCDPQLWFGNVEKTCMKSTKILYGNRSACDINRDHVKDVFNNRLPKYQSQYFKPVVEEVIEEIEEEVIIIPPVSQDLIFNRTPETIINRIPEVEETKKGFFSRMWSKLFSSKTQPNWGIYEA